jgi:hypothetical protein
MKDEKAFLEAFFKLDEEVQDSIIKNAEKRKLIKRRYSIYLERQKELYEELADIRSSCPHLNPNIRKIWDEDEYGKMRNNGWYDYTCPDCLLKWTEDFNE